jgi:hypothetical protein
MQSFVESFVEDSDFYGKLCFMLTLVVAPLVLAYEAREELSGPYRDIRRGFLYLGGLIVVASFAAWFFVTGGKQLWVSLITSLGPWLVGLFGVIIVCLLLLPVCAIDFHFHMLLHDARNPGSHNTSRRSTLAAYIGLAFLCVTGVLLLVCVSPKAAVIFAFVSLIALVVGWLGHIFVPDL